MSRQRIRTSVLESSTEKCPYCGGSGHVRSVSSLALQVLRALEEQLMKGATHNLIARTRPDVALYVLNQKRAHLRGLEERFAITITVSADESVTAPQAFIVDRGEQVHTPEAAKALAERTQADAAPLEDEDDLEDFVAAEDEGGDEAASPTTVPEQGEAGVRRRRRRRRGRGGRNGGDEAYGPRDQGHEAEHDQAHEHGPEHVAITGPADDPAEDDDQDAAQDESGEHQGEFAGPNRGENGEPGAGERRRRRGRRGGRRNRHRNGDGGQDRTRQDGRQDNGDDARPGFEHGSEETFARAEELIAPPSTEPELSNAVADLDAAPPTPREASTLPEASMPREERVRAEAPVPPSPPAEPEAPRRRSTVRERAPVTSGEDASANPAPPAPPPQPAPAVTENNAEGDQPRRTGWWSRRFAGG
jgi:ribonuclease E